ncbi:MAG: hypothetical protein JXA11_16875 [Phycisphaerae bacterium]|nr:hypothetical protein [Phycisphaerae bacterium]
MDTTIDITIEIVRAAVAGGILFGLLRVSRDEDVSRIPGWGMMVWGFVLIFFGSVIDISDNFEELNRFVVIGDTEIQAILEKVVGYLSGFLLVAIGIWRWLPKLSEHGKREREKHENDVQEQRLRVLRATMVSVQEIMNNLLNHLRTFRENTKKHETKDSETSIFLDYVIQDTTERLEKLSRLDSTPEKPTAAGIGIDYEKSTYTPEVPSPYVPARTRYDR